MYADLIDNELSIETARFAAILGLSPSKGARSPLLWNAAFAKAGIDAVMVPMDVRPENLAGLIAALKADERYVGGAVAVPHKQALVDLLDDLEPEARAIGAVNAIYRKDGKLIGANTDGAGALSALQDAAGDISARKALVMGLGGAGVAVAAYLAGTVAETTIANRTRATAEDFATRIPGNTKICGLPPKAEDLAGIDLLVNCTSVGYEGGESGTALGGEAEALLGALPGDAVVYDIVYQPLETELLKLAKARGLTTVNGLGMNLDQAVIAFEKANPGALTLEQIRAVMREAGK